MASIGELRSWLLLSVAVFVSLGLLYLLQPRRRQVRVPFGGLWRQVLEQAEARTMGRRWRRLLSFLLMAGIAALMLLARAEGSLGSLGMLGCSSAPERSFSHTVLLIDTSASMGTLDGRPPPGQELARPRVPRIEQALWAAREVIAAALPRERFLIMTASSRLRTRSGWSSDPVALGRALDGVGAGQAGLDLGRALSAARDALSGRREGRVVFLTDGGPPITPVEDLNDLRLQVISVGELSERGLKDASGAIDNVAVERVGVRALADDPGTGLLSVRLRNDRDQPSAVQVSVAALAGGQSEADFSDPNALRTVRELTLPPRVSRWLQIERVDLSLGRFSVRARPAPKASWRDLAPWDDSGFAVVAARKRLHVLLVGETNLFLEAALLANPRVALKVLKPQEYDPRAWSRDKKGTHGMDLVVLHDVGAPAPEGLPVLRLDAGERPEIQPEAPKIEAPELRLLPPAHPVTRGVSFQDANFDFARILKPGAGDRVLVQARGRRGGAVILASTRGVRRVTVGFDLWGTDLIGRAFLPLFLANAVDWLAGEEQLLLSPLEVGRVWAVQVPTTGQRWTYQAPGCPPVPARLSGDLLIASSELHGIHQWRAEEGAVVARPTRLSPTERPALTQVMSSRWEAPPRQAQARNQPHPTPLWFWLILGALSLLSLEWGLYLRRRTV